MESAWLSLPGCGGGEFGGDGVAVVVAVDGEPGCAGGDESEATAVGGVGCWVGDVRRAGGASGVGDGDRQPAVGVGEGQGEAVFGAGGVGDGVGTEFGDDQGGVVGVGGRRGGCGSSGGPG